MAMLATPITVTSPDAVHDAIELARAAQSQGADLVEWRVDTLAKDATSHASVVQLVQESPLPCIVTCRAAVEGGAFDGPEAQRVELLQALLDAGATPRFLDLEFDAWCADSALQGIASLLRAKGTALVLSHHDLKRRPANLLRCIAEMGEADCDVIKVAWHVNAVREALECADVLASQPKPMIALAMGEAGLISRVMTGAWGGLLTFAALDGNTATAPGQPTLSHLIERYQFRSINQQTRLYGLVGWPLGDSPGLPKHNEMFVECGWNAVYLPLPVREGWERFKADILSCIDHPHLPFGGVSVTMPHKANCLRLVQEAGGGICDAATAAGASNTLVVSPDGAIRAANTDVVGVVEPLRMLGATFTGATAAVLGAGGAARAACVGLLQAGASVRVFNRTPQRAQAVTDDLAWVGDIAVGSKEHGCSGPFDIVVQCTSVGMAHGGQPDGDAVAAVGFDVAMVGSNAVCLESVYDPLETVFVRAMRALGAQVATGNHMWATQAAAQQALWADGGW